MELPNVPSDTHTLAVPPWPCTSLLLTFLLFSFTKHIWWGMTVLRDWANLVFHGGERLHMLSLKLLQKGEQNGHKHFRKVGKNQSPRKPTSQNSTHLDGRGLTKNACSQALSRFTEAKHQRWVLGIHISSKPHGCTSHTV